MRSLPSNVLAGSVKHYANAGESQVYDIRPSNSTRKRRKDDVLSLTVCLVVHSPDPLTIVNLTVSDYVAKLNNTDMDGTTAELACCPTHLSWDI